MTLESKIIHLYKYKSKNQFTVKKLYTKKLKIHYEGSKRESEKVNFFTSSYPYMVGKILREFTRFEVPSESENHIFSV